MPRDAEVQTQMPLAPGTRAPGLDHYDMIENMSWKYRVVNKTANWTVKMAESGTIYTNTGASGKITATLPAPSAANAGCTFFFFNTDNDAIAVACTDKLVTFNNAAADAVEISDNTLAIGGCIQVISNGSLWLVFLFTYDGTDQPVTVTSA